VKASEVGAGMSVESAEETGDDAGDELLITVEDDESAFSLRVAHSDGFGIC